MTTKTFQPTGEVLVAVQTITKEQTKVVSRLLYIDNIRTFLTALVLVHHIMIVYASSGSWIYTEGRQDIATVIIGNIFGTVNQAFFMGLFLLISAYFVPGAYNRKGAAHFWKDRLARLGIPLVVYSWLIHPLFVYWYLRVTEGVYTSLWDHYSRYFSIGYWIGGGPLWFVETLLIFTLIYALWRGLVRPRSVETHPAEGKLQASFPSNRTLVVFGVIMGFGAFILRLKFPMGWNFLPLNLQIPYFAQYIAMFIAGLLAYNRDWLINIPAATGKYWLKVAGLVLLMYVPGALLGGALESDLPFLGGWHWQALYFAMWEAFLGVSLCIGVLHLFRTYADHQSRFGASLSRSAYAAYIVQAPVITAVALLAHPLFFHPLLKFVLVSLVAVPLCFTIGGFLCRLPYLKRVL